MKKEQTPTSDVQGTTDAAPAKKLNKKERREARAAKAAETAKDEKPAKGTSNLPGPDPNEGKEDKTATTTGEKKKSKKDKAKETLSKTNAAAVVDKITEMKDLKYIYPEDCQEGGTKDELLERRKKFRATVRRKVNSFEAEMKKLMEAEKPSDKAIRKQEKAYQAYAKEVYVNPKKELKTA